MPYRLLISTVQFVTGRKEHNNYLFYVKRAKSSIDFRAVIFYKYSRHL